LAVILIIPSFTSRRGNVVINREINQIELSAADANRREYALGVQRIASTYP